MKKYISLCILLLVCTFSATAQTVVDQLKKVDGLSVFARVVDACGLSSELSKSVDEDYQKYYWQNASNVFPFSSLQSTQFPEQRLLGFTLFAETDAFWQQTLGKAADAITAADIEAWAAKQGLSLKQFVTYHILPEKLSPDNLVIHDNEQGYNKNIGEPTIFVSEHYETLGEGRRLLQLCESAESEGVRLNRCPVLNEDTYHEEGAPLVTGIAVDREQVVRAANGYIYPITEALLYTDEVRQKVLGGRIRYDVAALFPELMNNDLRNNKSLGSSTAYQFPWDYPYLEGVTIEPGANFYYLPGQNAHWYNMQSDEFNLTGIESITLRLPPVPTDGVYELRVSTQSNSSRRGIAQYYIGTDPENLQATGLPIDHRVGGTSIRLYSGNQESNLGWLADGTDKLKNRIVDQHLYEQGVMKGPKAYTLSSSSTLRDNDACLRRIVCRGEFKAGENYYLRIGHVMNGMDYQICIDYLEWCPASVYDNPDKPEDIW